MTILAVLGIFTLNVINDFFAVLFVKKVGAGKATQAALCAMGIEVVAFLTVLAWVASPWYLLPAALGVFAGTFFTVKFDGRRKR